MGFGDGGKGLERSDVSVHAEEGLGDQEASAPIRTQASKMVVSDFDIEVGIDRKFGSREPTAIQEAGVNSAVGHDGDCRVQPGR